MDVRMYGVIFRSSIAESDDEHREEVIASLRTVRGVSEQLASSLYDDGVRSIAELVDHAGVPDAVRICAKYDDDLRSPISAEDAQRIMKWIELATAKAAMMKSIDAPPREIIIVGSHRRAMDRREDEPSTHDIDLLALWPAEVWSTISSHAAGIIESIAKTHPGFIATLACGPTHLSMLIRMRGVVRAIDLYAASDAEKGSMLLHTTGPVAFNIVLRKRAIKMGMRLSQHGLFAKSDDDIIARTTEREIFEALGLPFIAPGDRDDAMELVTSAPVTGTRVSLAEIVLLQHKP